MKNSLAISAILFLAACSGDNSPTAPSAAPANLAASYDVTVTASATCSASLPTETQVLNFLAEITQTGAAAQVKLIAKVPGVPETSFSGTVSGETITFPNFSFTQTMGRGAALSASGSASRASNGLTMTGPLNGTYQTSSGSSCNAANHQVHLVKLCLTPTSNGTAMLPCQQ